MRVRPTRRALLLVAAGTGPALLPVAAGAGTWVLWAGWLGACALALGAELLLLPAAAALRARLSTPAHLFVGVPGEARLHLVQDGARRTSALRVRLETDERLHPPPPATLASSGDGTASAVLPLHARRRGPARLCRLWMAWTGPLGLLERHAVSALDRELPVLPDVRASRAVALAMETTAHRAGNRVQRVHGDGSAFDSLRPWIAGLDARTIDWKATARHARLMSRQYRVETDQPLVLVFDTGSLAGEPLGGVPRLDHALEQGLALGAAALRCGDRVGLYSFGARPGEFSAPQGGLASWLVLQRAAARLDYGEQESNVTLGLLGLLQTLRRRTLVVVFTDFLDPITAGLLVDALGHLARRHVVLFVTLSDPLLAELERREPAELADVHRTIVAADLLRERAGVLARLRRLGVSVLESSPGSGVTPLVERYLALKQRERLG